MVLAAFFVFVSFLLRLCGKANFRGLEMIGENRAPVTGATLALATMAIYAVCVMFQSLGHTSAAGRIRPMGEYCHLFSITALWLTNIIGVSTDGLSYVVVARVLGITVFLGLLHWLTLGSSVGSRVMAAIMAFGYAAMFVASVLGAASILFAV